MRLLIQNLINQREFRFLVAGGALALMFFILAIAFVKIGLTSFVSGVLAYIIVLAVGYVIQRNWSFRARHAHATSLPRYVSLQVACAAISGLNAHVATTFFQMNPIAMSISNTFVMGLISFIVSLKWVFPNDQTIT